MTATPQPLLNPEVLHQLLIEIAKSAEVYGANALRTESLMAEALEMFEQQGVERTNNTQEED